MYCNSCGAQVKDGARFCPKCGTPVDEAPAITPRPIEQPVATQPVQQQYVEPQPMMAAAPVNTADMPSVGTATFLCVVGCLCGIIWGVYGFSQRSGMKDAIARGDVDTAKKKFKSIVIATCIGIVLNVLLIIGQMAQAGSI